LEGAEKMVISTMEKLYTEGTKRKFFESIQFYAKAILKFIELNTIYSSHLNFGFLR
jgi:hypothetical protein